LKDDCDESDYIHKIRTTGSKEVEKPTPKEDEVLVEVHAATVNYGDLPILRGEPLQRLMTGGLLKPKHKILGDDIAGRVEAVGENVKQFQPGDEVFGISDFGAFAEYVCAREDLLVLKPASMTFEEAAAVPFAATTALNGLRDKGQFQSGQKVLINGASGGVGTFAVQMANYFGAEVTGVCSTSKVDMVCSIGADHVIDYTQKDFTKNGETYDVIIDVVGRKLFSRRLKSLKRKGYYFLANAGLSHVALGLWTSIAGGKKVKFSATGMRSARKKANDLVFIKELIEARKIKAVIDRRYPLEQIAEAHRYVEKGHKKGNVVITV